MKVSFFSVAMLSVLGMFSSVNAIRLGEDIKIDPKSTTEKVINLSDLMGGAAATPAAPTE